MLHASSSLLYSHCFTDIPMKVYSSSIQLDRYTGEIIRLVLHASSSLLYLYSFTDIPVKYTAHLYSLTDTPAKSYISCYIHRHYFCIYTALPIYWCNHTSRTTMHHHPCHHHHQHLFLCRRLYLHQH